VIIELGLSPDQSRQIHHLAAEQSFGEGQAIVLAVLGLNLFNDLFDPQRR
jgi:hypothetical protein